MAFAMADLHHHRAAATERPTIDNGLFRVNLPDHRASYSE